MDATGQTADASGWQAHLRLAFGTDERGTVLRAREHRGPLVVQRAFHPEGREVCHVYLLHPPGGLVGGDELSLELEVDTGARALVTTPAATKVYRSGGGRAAQRQRLRVAEGAILEWLPQETIVYEGARVDLETRVDLAAGAVFVGWEIVCLGRTAAGEGFARGLCRQRFELWGADRPLCLERARLEGGAPALGAAWGLGGAPVSGTLLAAPAVPDALEGLRALADALPEGDHGSATALDGVLVCRYAGGSAARARDFFTRAWGLLRPPLCGRPPTPPRIWMT